jgi:hypothetical protein
VLRFIGLFPSIMAATVTLGVAPLLFLQLVYPSQMYSASIVSGWFWGMIIPVVIAAYYLLYGASFSERGTSSGKALHLWPALVALGYVSLVYSSVFSMAEHPQTIATLYAADQSGLVWNPNLGEYAFRWLHMVTGALTVGGFFAGALTKNCPESFPLARKMFIYGMAAAAVAGFCYLFTLGGILRGFMHSPGIWALAFAILLSAGALHFFYRRSFFFSGSALFASLLLMVATRHQVRLLKLRPDFDPASWRVAPQWSAFLIFLACFLLACALVFYMLLLLRRCQALKT